LAFVADERAKARHPAEKDAKSSDRRFIFRAERQLQQLLEIGMSLATGAATRGGAETRLLSIEAPARPD
jgi:hypothetical protein